MPVAVRDIKIIQDAVSHLDLLNLKSRRRNLENTDNIKYKK